MPPCRTCRSDTLPSSSPDADLGVEVDRDVVADQREQAEVDLELLDVERRERISSGFVGRVRIETALK